MQPDERASVVARDLKSPNGSMATPDGRLIVGESGAQRLVSYPIKPDGTLGEMTVDAVLEGSPDSSCLDLEGGVWAALFDKNRFDRMLNGKIVESIETPGRHAIACQRGGADHRTLFCLTYRGALEDIGKAPRAQGRLWQYTWRGPARPDLGD